MSERKAFVLGAGPVGLVTAWKLMENGWDAEIYEKEDIVGGLCRTLKWNNFLVDIGPHIYHTPDKELAKYWESEFGDLFIHENFWCKNVKGKTFGEYWDYPLSWESISRYPKQLKEKILKEIHNLDREKKAVARNYTEYIEAQVGPTLRQLFFKIYPEKIWGMSTDKMSPDWAPKRIEFRQKVTPFYHNEWNAVGKYGTGCIFERIRENIIKLGGTIHTGVTVTGLQYNDKDIIGIAVQDREGSPIVRVQKNDIIISSLPLPILAGFLRHESDMKFRGVRMVYVAYKRDVILPKGIHWLYYDSAEFFHRITEPKKLSPHVAPHNKTYLTAEIAMSKGDAIDKMPSEELKQKVIEQIEYVGLAKKSDVLDAGAHSEYFVYPIQHAGYQEEVSKARSAVSRFKQLYSIGSAGEFHYADIQILFHKAFDTAAILSERDSSYTQVIRQTPRCTLNPVVNVAGRKIGEGESSYIIAEAGLNHNGSIDLAKKLVDRAKDTGCNAIKFQTFKRNSRISRKVKSARYAETIIGTEETLYGMFDRLAMSRDAHKELFTYAREKDIEIFSTPFDFESVDFLNSLSVNVFKIASMDLVNLPLIRYIAKKGKPIILSTGMSTLGQIEEALETIIQEGNPNVMLLHCNSSYPAAPDEMNLKVIQTLKDSFKVPVGLSDHTIGLFVSHTALVMGANLIERHFTLDRTMEGPDHILSSEPAELAKLVSMSRMIPVVLGSGIKRIQPNEYDTLNMQRKSLYAARPIIKGEIITDDMIAIKGPGGGLLPRYFDIVVGREAKQDIEEDYPITWENV